MGSRENILQAIKQNKPTAVPLPSIPSFDRMTDNPVSTFVDTLTSIGGYCLIVKDLHPVKDFLTQQKQQGFEVVNGINAVDDYNIDAYKDHTASELETINTVAIKGRIAVAENGAVWLTESNFVNRSLPFICEHLIIVVDKESIVANMHEAYTKITIDEEGYGVFIAGPSKTADIEQSLVVGAHGPLSLQVYIV
jgi:L-lactate dehydrogenase complex protein LldG